MKILKTPDLQSKIDSLEEALGTSIQSSDDFNEYLFEKENKKKQGSYEFSDILDIKEYEENPYQKLFKNINVQKGNITFKTTTLKAYSSFLFDEITGDQNSDYAEINPIGHFLKDFSYPIIYKKQTPWMSIVPHEINTMKQCIDDSNGNVLTFGCGLGYFAFMASNKENVKSVTIVDNDPSVIALFKEFILPKFPHKEKITVICKNCFAFCNENSKLYDYLFVDTYHTPEDGLPFLIKLNPLIKKVSKESSFWIYPSMITYFRRYITYALIDIFNGDVNEEDFVQNGEDALDDILALFIQKTKGITLSNSQEIDDFLSDQNISKILLD